jgi:hypothetical protein
VIIFKNYVFSVILHFNLFPYFAQISLCFFEIFAASFFIWFKNEPPTILYNHDVFVSYWLIFSLNWVCLYILFFIFSVFFNYKSQIFNLPFNKSQLICLFLTLTFWAQTLLAIFWRIFQTFRYWERWRWNCLCAIFLQILHIFHWFFRWALKHLIFCHGWWWKFCANFEIFDV